jgi:D-alanyl-D-alanine carboxypeptidase (penicillin-binding protein 5/6)
LLAALMNGLKPQQSAKFLRDFRMSARAILALAAMVACALPALAQHIQVTAPHAVLMDFKTGSILFSRGADEPLSPANMAKLMTLAVVFGELKSGKITLDTEYQVSNHAWRTGGAPSGMSTMFAALRSRIRVEDLITGVAVLSGNDAAIVLAEGIAGSEQAFVKRMNEYAVKLGLATARFRNATGVQHAEQRISARDLMKLASHLIREYPDYYKYFKVPEMTWSKIKQSNRNPLLGSSLGVDGLLTGSTKENGYGFVASADNNTQRLIVVVQGSRSEKDRMEDARRLLDWGFRAFADRLLLTGSNEVARASVYGGTQGSVALNAKSDLHILSLQGTNERFTARVVYEGPLRAPIVKGTEVAKLRVFRGDQIAYEAPLFAAEDVPLGSIFGRAYDSAYEFVASFARSVMRKVFTRNS